MLKSFSNKLRGSRESKPIVHAYVLATGQNLQLL